jgi:hypothetical protein
MANHAHGPSFHRRGSLGEFRYDRPNGAHHDEALGEEVRPFADEQIANLPPQHQTPEVERAIINGIRTAVGLSPQEQGDL